MNMRTRVVLYVCISAILSNVGCENREDLAENLAEDHDSKKIVALVAVGTEDTGNDEDVSVEGILM